MVHFDDAIPPGFKATATQRTPFTSLCLVPGTFSDIPAGCLAAFGPYAGHALSHGANVIIPFRIVMEALRMEWFGSITGTLLFMEEVVFDEGLYPVLPHEPVVFFRTITGIRHTCAGKPAIAFPE